MKKENQIGGIAIQPVSISSRVSELARRAFEHSIMTCTAFLTPAEQLEITGICHKLARSVLFFGGNPDAERKIAFFLPDHLTAETFEPENSISTFSAISKFAVLSHRDFLGALMGLGVKRECIGDIYVGQDCTYFYTTAAISEFVRLNLTHVGKYGVSLNRILPGDVLLAQKKTEKVSFTVKSLRLDRVAAGAFSVSRSTMGTLIAEGSVILNDTPCLKPDALVSKGDRISARGYGKAEITDNSGISKKGRFFVNVARYV